MKRFICVILMIALCTVPVFAMPEVGAPSAILVEASTGQVLFEKDSHARMRPASVTKIMTLILVMEALDSGAISWDDVVTASADATKKGGSQVYLKEGEQMSMEEMIKSVAVASANDCAAALAEHVSGSESAFVEKMNAKAAELGMNDTHFVNCTGLDDAPEAAEHLTSAADIAIMSRELLKHDAIRKYTTIWTDSVRGGQFGLTNTNKLVRFFDGTTGLKTGYTSAAGYCVSATAIRDGMELIAVILHSPTSPERFQDAKTLLNYGFAEYALVHPEPEEPLQKIPVILGTAEYCMPVLPDDGVLLQKNRQSEITVETNLPETLDAPVSQGQKIGTLTVRAGEEILAQLPLTAQNEIPRLTWWQIFCRILGGLCTAEL